MPVHKLKLKQGFTLIELLLVISIIGLLATLAMVTLNNARTQARDTKRLADLNKIQQALEMHLMDVGAYPTGSGLILGDTASKCLNSSGWQTVNCTNPYIDRIPTDPGFGGMDYTYTRTSEQVYRIDFVLERGVVNYPAGACRALPAVVINCP